MRAKALRFEAISAVHAWLLSRFLGLQIWRFGACRAFSSLAIDFVALSSKSTATNKQPTCTLGLSLERSTSTHRPSERSEGEAGDSTARLLRRAVLGTHACDAAGATHRTLDGRSASWIGSEWGRSSAA
jgi:hypothetical protein